MTQTERTLYNIKTGPEGMEFLEYLKALSLDNYLAFKKDGPAMNDIHKGYAIAIDSLLQAFEMCDQKPQEQNVDDKANMHY